MHPDGNAVDETETVGGAMGDNEDGDEDNGRSRRSRNDRNDEDDDAINIDSTESNKGNRNNTTVERTREGTDTGRTLGHTCSGSWARGRIHPTSQRSSKALAALDTFMHGGRDRNVWV